MTKLILPLIQSPTDWALWVLGDHDPGGDAGLPARLDAPTMRQICAAAGADWDAVGPLWWRLWATHNSLHMPPASSIQDTHVELPEALAPRAGTSGRLHAALHAALPVNSPWSTIWASGLLTRGTQGVELTPVEHLPSRLELFCEQLQIHPGAHAFVAHHQHLGTMRELAHQRELLQVEELAPGRPIELAPSARALLLALPPEGLFTSALPEALAQARLSTEAVEEAPTQRIEVQLTEALEPTQAGPPPEPVPASQRREDPLEGRLLQGRYRLMGRLGEGGFGAVYLAHDERLERDVALKLMSAEMVERDRTGSLLKRFIQEAKLVARLDHPHIAPVLDFGTLRLEDVERPFYVMKYLNGRDLHALLREEGALEPGRALELTRQMLDALAYVHQRDIIHRDLKPENLFITTSRQVDLQEHLHVVDFGIAYVDESPHGRLTDTSQGSPRTPDYAPPELLLGGEQTSAIDVYQVGLILCEMLTGRVLLRSVTNRLGQMVPRELDQGQLGQVLRRALCVRAEERYPDAGAMLEAVRQLDPEPLVSPTLSETQAQPRVDALDTGPALPHETEPFVLEPDQAPNPQDRARVPDPGGAELVEASPSPATPPAPDRASDRAPERASAGAPARLPASDHVTEHSERSTSTSQLTLGLGMLGTAIVVALLLLGLITGVIGERRVVEFSDPEPPSAQPAAAEPAPAPGAPAEEPESARGRPAPCTSARPGGAAPGGGPRARHEALRGRPRPLRSLRGLRGILGRQRGLRGRHAVV